MVLAINADDVAVRSAFRAKENLNFSLLSDTSKNTLRAYGALDDNGQVKRVTYLVAPDGTVRGVDDAVDAQIQGTGPERQSDHGANLALLFSDWHAELGNQVPPFFLPDSNRRSRSWLKIGSRATVIVALDGSDKDQSMALNRIERLASFESSQDISILAVGKTFPPGADSFGLTVVADPHSDVLPRLNPGGEPLVVVLDRHHKVVYRGPDQGLYNGKATNFVAEVVNAVRAGRSVPRFSQF